MNPDIRIVRGNVADIPALLPMIAEYWRFEDIHFAADAVELSLRRVLSTPELGAIWIAFDGDVAIGYLLGIHLFSLEFGGIVAEIDELFVTAEARGRGVGAHLIGAAESGFVAAGCGHVSLQLARDNNSARSFYRALGYTERDKYELLGKPLVRG